MPSKQLGRPLPDVVPERVSGAVRCYAEHLAGLDMFDVRLLDRFMRHECRCPGQRRTGRRPGQQRRQFAIRFLRYLLETCLGPGRKGQPPHSPRDPAREIDPPNEFHIFRIQAPAFQKGRSDLCISSKQMCRIPDQRKAGVIAIFVRVPFFKMSICAASGLLGR